MRSTTFTSLALALTAGAAGAADFPPGCWHRDYSAAHLREHPAQVVDRITLTSDRDQFGNTYLHMRVATARQGHVARTGHGGQVLEQWLSCWDEGGRAFCAVECDGGSLTVTRVSEDTLTFETRYLLVGETEECGGAIDLAEVPGDPVRYRLNRVPDSTCDGL